ncbi:translation elongation factor Ts [Buchnera aphidicola]|nr:translation elongation factor Ts [Buchnera aphidicola]
MVTSIKLIKELRMKTGSGFLECKVALQKSNGNLAHAIDYLRTAGACLAERKILRKTKFGRIFLYQQSNLGVLLELNSETDFVSSNKEFENFGQMIIDFAGSNNLFDIEKLNNFFEQKKILLISKFSENIVIRRIQYLTGNMITSYMHLGKIGVILSGTNSLNSCSQKKHFKYVAMHIAATNPRYLSETDIPSDIMIREKNIQSQIAEKTGKNPTVLQAIIQGRMNKFINEISLIRQSFIKNPKITVGEYLKKHRLSINSFIRFQVSEKI